MRWRYFIAAAILGAILLLTAGAPPIPVALGVTLALIFTLYKARKV
jgi:hypothetical protein